MSHKILISTSLRNLSQVLTLIKCCFLGGFFFLAIHQHYMSKCPKGINFLSIHWNYNVFKIKAYRIISPSQKSRIQHVPLIKYPIKINNKNFHNLILYIRKWRYMVPCVKIVTAQKNTIMINCIKKWKKSSSFPNFTAPTCHTRQEPIPFLPASN